MGALFEIVLIAIFACMLLVVTDNGVGPAAEAPSHLNIFARAAYYTFHRRFRDFIVPCSVMGIFDTILHGRIWPGHIWKEALAILCVGWLMSLFLMRVEAFMYRNKPWGAEETMQWTEGMTRSKFFQLKQA